MPEYIEREATLSELDKSFKLFGEHDDIIRLYSDARSSVIYAPAADVAPVVHGRWEVYLGGKELMCSACKATFWDEDGVGGSNYCPNCGAKMDGV